LEEGAPALIAVRRDSSPATRGVYSVASGEMLLAADAVFDNAYGLANGAIAAHGKEHQPPDEVPEA